MKQFFERLTFNNRNFNRVILRVFRGVDKPLRKLKTRKCKFIGNGAREGRGNSGNKNHVFHPNWSCLCGPRVCQAFQREFLPEFRFPADKIQSRSLNPFSCSRSCQKIGARDGPRNGLWKRKTRAQVFRGHQKLRSLTRVPISRNKIHARREY